MFQRSKMVFALLSCFLFSHAVYSNHKDDNEFKNKIEKLTEAECKKQLLEHCVKISEIKNKIVQEEESQNRFHYSMASIFFMVGFYALAQALNNNDWFDGGIALVSFIGGINMVKREMFHKSLLSD